MLRRSLVLALCGAIAVYSQTRKSRHVPVSATAAPGSDYPIEKLSVRGNQHYTAAQVLAVAGLRVGEKADVAIFDAARDRLLATGVFDRAGYQYAPSADSHGYDAVIEVAEETQFYPLLFEDLPATDVEIQTWLAKKDPLFGKDAPATPPVIKRYTQWIEDLLASKGVHAKVKGELSPENLNELSLVFHPDGPQRTVAQVTFLGVKSVDMPDVLRAIGDVAVGVPYTEMRFRQLLDGSVRPLYEAIGRLRVSFPKIDVKPDPGVKGLALTVTVDEGPVYKFGQIRIDGGPDKRLKLEPGRVADFSLVKAAQDTLTHTLRKQGYLESKLSVVRTMHDDSHTVDVHIQIQKGQRYTFAKLDIVGLDLISEPAIRKLWGIQPGKPYDTDYPDYFLKVVRDQGYFDHLGKTWSERKVNETDHTVDVTLHFTGDAPKKKPEDTIPGVQRDSDPPQGPAVTYNQPYMGYYDCGES